VRVDRSRILIHENGLVLDTDAGPIPVESAALARLARRILKLQDGLTAEAVLSDHTTPEIPSDLSDADGASARALLDLFAHAGLVSNDVAGRGKLANEFREARVAVAGSAAWAQDLRVWLDEAGLSLVALDAAPDLLVVAADISDPEEHRRHAKLGRFRNLPTLHGTLGRGEVMIGPLFHPGLGACWSCARGRRIANDPNPAAAYRLDLHRSERPLVPQDAGLAGRIAAGMLAIDVIKILTRGDNTLLGRIRLLNLATPAAAAHSIVPLPECEVCGGAGAITDPTRYRLDLAAIVDAASPMLDFPGWVDAASGVINAVWVEEASECGGLCFARAQPASLPRTRKPPAPADLCGGKGLTRGEALRSALGEALERYAAAHVLQTRIVTAAVDELDGAVLAPDALGLYSDEQYARPDFPFKRFDPRRRYHWILGELLPDGRAIWVPAEAASFAARSVGDQLCQVTTSGLALGRNKDDAAMRAVLELVERDAAMMCWLCRLPGRRILPDRADSAVNAVICFLESLGAVASFYLLEVGIPIPTVVACSFGDGVRWPGLCVGSASNPSPHAALRAAALELAATGRGLVRARSKAIVKDAVRFDRFGDHGMHYFDRARAEAAEFLDRTAPASCAIPPQIASENVGDLATLLAGLDISVALVDLTPPDVALSGLRVVRAVSDGLLPIHCGFSFERLGSRRLANRGPLNADLHPFC